MISKSPRPWEQRVVNGAVFDANDRIVSFVDNAEFVLHAVQVYDRNVATLRLVERLASASSSGTDQAIAEIVRLALYEVDHPRTPAPRQDMPARAGAQEQPAAEKVQA